jgi:hypothetical protein
MNVLNESLMEASLNGQLATAISLIKRGASMHAKDNMGRTPLHFACHHGHLDTALALIKRGANIHDKSNDGRTPLHFASNNGQLDTALALIERGANMHAKDNNGWTPLHLASCNGYLNTAMALIERGASIHDKSNHGWTPLHSACRKYHIDIALGLIREGANLYETDSGGHTCLAMTGIIADPSRHINAAMIEQAKATLQDAYKRESYWRRRKYYVIFLSTIKTAAEDETLRRYGTRTRAVLGQVRVLLAIDRVFCRKDTQRLIASYL